MIYLNFTYAYCIFLFFLNLLRVIIPIRVLFKRIQLAEAINNLSHTMHSRVLIFSLIKREYQMKVYTRINLYLNLITYNVRSII